MQSILHRSSKDLMNHMPNQFEAYTHQLVGIEALWEVVLVAPNEEIFKRALTFMVKLYRQVVQNGADVDIKELIYQSCLTHIRNAVQRIHEMNQEFRRTDAFIGSDFESILACVQETLHPLLTRSESLDEPRLRICRSIAVLSRFIKDFEKLGSSVEKSTKHERLLNISVNNMIGSTSGPKTISLLMPSTMKVGELKDQIGTNLNEERAGLELSVLYRGKDLTEDQKTLRDVGMRPADREKNEAPIKLMLTLNQPAFTDDFGAFKTEISEAQLTEGLGNLRAFLGDLPTAEGACKLALKKCNLNLEEVIMMLTDPDRVAELTEEAENLEAAEVEKQ